MKLFIDKLKNHIYWLKISSGLYDGMDDETFLKMAYPSASSGREPAH